MTGPKHVSEKQLAANRANARKSTGPRTAAGKARASQNAVTHGILARAVIPRALESFESRPDFDQFLQTLTAAYAPVGIVEELLVQQIAAAYWRLARVYRAEGGDIAIRQKRPQFLMRNPTLAMLPVAPDSPEGLRRQRDALSPLLDDAEAMRATLIRHDATFQDLTDEEMAASIRAKLDQIDERLAQHEAQRREVHAAINSLPDLDAALKFARYETALQRQLDRAFSRLERLQQERGAEPISHEFALIEGTEPAT